MKDARTSFDHLREGLSVEQAVEGFLDGCNHGPDRLWISESWVRPRIERLTRSARSPLGEEQAAKLRDVVLKRESFDYVIEWICDHSEMSWSEFDQMRRAQEVELVWTEVRRAFLRKPVKKPYRQLPDYGGLQTEDAIVQVFSNGGSSAPESGQTQRCPSCGRTPDLSVIMVVSHRRGPMNGRWWAAKATLCAPCGILVELLEAKWINPTPLESVSERADEPGELPADGSRPYQSLDALDPDKVQAAVRMLRHAFSPETQRELRKLMTTNPNDWNTQLHFGFGMSVRNQLRANGFDERFFEVHNLDDYWAGLTQLAFGESDS